MISGERIRLWEGEDIADGRIIYGHWDRNRDGEFVQPDHVTYSDYSGSLVDRANLEEFMEQFEDSRGVEWTNTTGGHGTTGLIVRFDADERVPEIGEFFDALEGYPLANEERHSELEMEAVSEAWDSYGRHDFIRDFDEAELFDSSLAGLADGDEALLGAVPQFYRAVSDLYGANPEVEDAAGSVAFHTDYIFKGLSAFVDDLGEASDVESGPKAFEKLLLPVLKGDMRQVEYGGWLYDLLAAHRDISYGPKRMVFLDTLKEFGLDPGLEILRAERKRR